MLNKCKCLTTHVYCNLLLARVGSATESGGVGVKVEQISYCGWQLLCAELLHIDKSETPT